MNHGLQFIKPNASNMFQNHDVNISGTKTTITKKIQHVRNCWNISNPPTNAGRQETGPTTSDLARVPGNKAPLGWSSPQLRKFHKTTWRIPVFLKFWQWVVSCSIRCIIYILYVSQLVAFLAQFWQETVPFSLLVGNRELRFLRPLRWSCHP